MEHHRSDATGPEDELAVLDELDALAALVEARQDLFVWWSAGPSADLAGESCDQLTGVELPGLSANSLSLESWWEGRPVRGAPARRPSPPAGALRAGGAPVGDGRPRCRSRT